MHTVKLGKLNVMRTPRWWEQMQINLQNTHPTDKNLENTSVKTLTVETALCQ